MFIVTLYHVEHESEAKLNNCTYYFLRDYVIDGAFVIAKGHRQKKLGKNDIVLI